MTGDWVPNCLNRVQRQPHVLVGVFTLMGMPIVQFFPTHEKRRGTDILNIRCALASHLFDTLWESLHPFPAYFVMASTPKPQLCLN